MYNISGRDNDLSCTKGGHQALSRDI